MRTIETIRDFLDAFVDWASDLPDIYGIALVGSYARGAARDDSDIDLVLLTDRPQKYLDDIQWTERFGTVEKHQTEDYVKLISPRVWYRDGYEVEYGITMSAPPNQSLPLVQPGVQSHSFIKTNFWLKFYGKMYG
jgi:predicted nucleotidyltransferase